MRHPDWLARLTRAMESWRVRHFVYGVNDCGRFGADCVEAVTGKRFEMPYGDMRTALRWVKQGGGVEALITERLGPPVDGRPRRGDVCLVETDDGPGIGVSLGATIAVPAERGLGQHPVRSLRHWRI